MKRILTSLALALAVAVSAVATLASAQGEDRRGAAVPPAASEVSSTAAFTVEPSTAAVIPSTPTVYPTPGDTIQPGPQSPSNPTNPSSPGPAGQHLPRYR